MKSFHEELTLDDEEQTDIYYKFFTLVSLLSGKKETVQNIIITTLEDKIYFNIAKEILDIDSKIDFLKNILELEPSLAKSKILLSYGNECIERRNTANKRKTAKNL